MILCEEQMDIFGDGLNEQKERAGGAFTYVEIQQNSLNCKPAVSNGSSRVYNLFLDLTETTTHTHNYRLYAVVP